MRDKPVWLRLTEPGRPGSLAGVLNNFPLRSGLWRGWIPALTVAVVLAAQAPLLAAPDPRAIQEQMNATAAEYGRIQSQLALTEARITKLESDLARADQIVAQKTVDLRERVGYLYRSGGAGTYLEGLLTASDIRVLLRRIQLLGILGEQDSKLVEGLQMTKSRAGVIRQELQSARARQKALLASLVAKQRRLEAQFRGAKAAARVARFGNFDSFTLPILGPRAFANTWGDPRSRGRRHKGTDVMAPCGAQVVAVTNGVLSDMHSGGAGGIMLWLRAINGDVFFYAHLRGYAPGSHEGKRVSTGDHIAYNGNSGNARGGPCHVHFEWHPRGGSAANPYSLLRAALG